ncbi:MAG: BadF/BadG/BcrA/BcrD ATPase family protein [Pseudomonadota bacterium]|nr:BadF/BadG/BcrA/BcrD ATPase family protein [Pseudomonadota bacterium]
MSSDHLDQHIAIDCGGTNCRAVLRLEARAYDYRGRGANAFSHLDRSQDCLREAIAALADQSGADIRDVPCYVSLAGAIDDRIQASVAAALPLSRVVVQEDCMAAVVGALDGADGFVAALGTGSFFARWVGGQVRHIGGYGLTLGDEASGAWIGRALLARALMAEEGRTDMSAFLTEVFEEFGGRSGIISGASTMAPADFAKLAPRVTDAALASDRGALGILSEGAGMIMQALSDLGWQSGDALCLTGGLADAYASYLPPDAHASLVPPKGDGLAGAVILAERFARGAL